MVVKQEKVSMPMASAGIVGYSPDMKVGMKEIDPKVLVVVTFLIVLIVKVADFLVVY